jgi:hypothetical protein
MSAGFLENRIGLISRLYIVPHMEMIKLTIQAFSASFYFSDALF